MAKVSQIRMNLERVARYAREFLLDTLTYAPPYGARRYRIYLRICIEELNEEGGVEGSFTFEETSTHKTP